MFADLYCPGWALRLGLVLFMLIASVRTNDDHDEDQEGQSPSAYGLPRSEFCPASRFFRDKCYVKNCLRRWHDPLSDCWCPFGYYNQWASANSSCLKCHAKCRSCLGSPHFCTSCADPTLIPPFCCQVAKDFRTGCHRSRAVKYQCIRCHNTCRECARPDDRDSCTKCKVGAKLNGLIGRCLPGDSMYQDQSTGENLPCYNSCKSCVGPGEYNCTSCKGSYMLMGGATSGKCVCDTTKNYFLAKDGTCQQCNPKCSKCQGDPNNCGVYAANATCFQEYQCSGLRWNCKCNDGYFEDSDLKCNKCDKSCKTCSGNSSNSCLSCKENAVYVELQKGYRTCACKTGYKLNPTTGDCYLPYNSTCHKTCATCSGPLATQCTTCQPDISAFNPLNNSCECYFGQYSDPANSNSACMPYQQCEPKYRYNVVYNQNGAIVNQSCSCPSGFGRDPTATKNQFACYSCSCNWGCDPNNYLKCLCNSTTFVAMFRSSGYWDYTLQRCQLCDPTCATCVGPSSSDCLSCNQTGVQPTGLPGRCSAIVPPPNPTTCDVTCATCSVSYSPTSCLSCTTDKQLVAGSCLCTQTSQFLNPFSGVCENCGNYCRSCARSSSSSPLECLLCADGMELAADGLNCRCPAHSGLAVDPATGVAVCAQCAAGCDNCSSDNATNCLVCSLGYYSTPGGGCSPCHSTCAACTSGQASACTDCALGYYFVNSSTSTSGKICVQNFTCPEGCVYNCELLGTIPKCKSCDLGYYMNTATSSCVKCTNPRCGTCQVSTSATVGVNSAIVICQTCSDSTMSLVNGDCICPSGKFYSLDQQLCVGCDLNCLECSGSPQNCTTCRAGTNLMAFSTTDGVQEFHCGCSQPGYFYDSDTLACIQCDASCSQCTSPLGCTKCATNNGILLVQTPESPQGLCTCPQGYFRLPDQSCSACHPLCATCKGPGLDQCTTCAFVTTTAAQPNTATTGFVTCLCPNRYQFNVDTNKCESCDSISPTNQLCSQFLPNSCTCAQCQLSNSYVSAAGFCTQCPPLCASCSSQLSCNTCTNFSLLAVDQYNFTTCICPEKIGFNTTTSQCTICPVGTFPRWGNSMSTFDCVGCSEGCEVCTGPSQCSKYKDGWIPSNNGTSTNSSDPSPQTPGSSNSTSPTPDIPSQGIPTSSSSNSSNSSNSTSSPSSGSNKQQIVTVSVRTFLSDLFLSVLSAGPYSSPQNALKALHRQQGFQLVNAQDQSVLPVDLHSVWNEELAQANQLRVITEPRESVQKSPATIKIWWTPSARLLQSESDENASSPQVQAFEFKSVFVSRSALFTSWEVLGPFAAVFAGLIIVFVVFVRPWIPNLVGDYSSSYLLHSAVWIQLTLLLGVLGVYFNGVVDKILLAATHDLLTVFSIGMFKVEQEAQSLQDVYMGKFSGLRTYPSITKLLLVPLLIHLALWITSVGLCFLKRKRWLQKANLMRQSFTIGITPLMSFAIMISILNYSMLIQKSARAQIDFAISILECLLFILDYVLLSFPTLHSCLPKYLTFLSFLTHQDTSSQIRFDTLSNPATDLNDHRQRKLVQKIADTAEIAGISLFCLFMGAQGRFGNSAGFICCLILFLTILGICIQKECNFKLLRSFLVTSLATFCGLGAIFGIFENSSSLEGVRFKSVLALILFDIALILNVTLFVMRILPILKNSICSRKKQPAISQVAPIIARASSSDKLVPNVDVDTNLQLPLPGPINPAKSDKIAIDAELPAKPDESYLFLNSSPQNRALRTIEKEITKIEVLPKPHEPEADNRLPKLAGKVNLPWKSRGNQITRLTGPTHDQFADLLEFEKTCPAPAQTEPQIALPKTTVPLDCPPQIDQPIEDRLPELVPRKQTGKVNLNLKRHVPPKQVEVPSQKLQGNNPGNSNEAAGQPGCAHAIDKTPDKASDSVATQLPQLPGQRQSKSDKQEQSTTSGKLEDKKNHAFQEDTQDWNIKIPRSQQTLNPTSGLLQPKVQLNTNSLPKDWFDESEDSVDSPPEANRDDSGQDGQFSTPDGRKYSTRPELQLPASNPSKIRAPEDPGEWLPYHQTVSSPSPVSLTQNPESSPIRLIPGAQGETPHSTKEPEELSRRQNSGFEEQDPYLSPSRYRPSRHVPISDSAEDYIFPDGSRFKKANNSAAPTEENRMEYRFADGERIRKERFPVVPDYERHYFRRRAPEDVPVTADSDSFWFRDGSRILRRHAHKVPDSQDDTFVYFREREEYRYLRSRHPVCEEFSTVYPPGRRTWFQIPREGSDYVLPDKTRVSISDVRNYDFRQSQNSAPLLDIDGRPVALAWIRWIARSEHVRESEENWRDPRELPCMDDEEYFYYDDGMKIKKRQIGEPSPKFVDDRYVEYTDGERIPIGRYLRLSERLSLLEAQSRQAEMLRLQKQAHKSRMMANNYTPFDLSSQPSYSRHGYTDSAMQQNPPSQLFGHRFAETKDSEAIMGPSGNLPLWFPPNTDSVRVRLEQRKVIQGRIWS